MGTQTIYTCDRCNKTVEWSIGRRTLHSISVTVDGNQCAHPILEWCRECVVEIGLVKWTPIPPQKKEDLPEPISIEDLIREIVREELGQ